MVDSQHDLSSSIRSVPDFPRKGIVFRDITTLLQNPKVVRQVVRQTVDHYREKGIQKVVAIEARGFILGAILAYELNAGFVPARKPGKLPARTLREEYALEYGNDSIEMHHDGVLPGEKVLVHDDLLATGGTAAAACRLVRKLGGRIMGVSFLVELTFLNGREKLKGLPVFSLLRYDRE